MGLRSVNLQQVKVHSRLPEQDSTYLRLENIAFYYDNTRTVLKNVSLSAGKGAIVGVIGNNGVGKSTLLEIICGLQKEKSGSVILNGSAAGPKFRNKETFLVMQNSDYQLFTESVEKELYLGSSKDKEQSGRGLSLLKQMGLLEYLQRHPASLSGGQKQRLCIAVACMKNSDVICFDEPTSGLDYISMKNVSDLLNELSSMGKVLIVTSHDYEFLMATCTHICHLKDGDMADCFPVNETTAPTIYKILLSKEETK